MFTEVERYGPVHGSGINVGIAQPGGYGFGSCTLAAGGVSINGNDYFLHVSSIRADWSKGSANIAKPDRAVVHEAKRVRKTQKSLAGLLNSRKALAGSRIFYFL
jgi:hypothetical protein